MLNKRTVKLGDYDTAVDGWTLTGCALSDAEQKTNYVEKTGGDGDWDMSTVLSAGIPRYRNRALVITLENSQGDRTSREKIISRMVNRLDGLEWPIVLPDYPDHYLLGRLHVAVNYSDLAHAMVTVTATCQPWLYRARETTRVIDAPITISTETTNFIILNEGRKVVSPSLTVAGTAHLTFNGNRTDLTTGTYEWPALQLVPGENVLNYTGTGTLTLKYREAVLR